MPPQAGHVRLVVTNGCSFTYGAQLDDPARSCWGRVVADALDSQFVNLAAGGGSNQRLVRTTVEQLPRLAELYGCQSSEVLFLGMWTELPRWETYDPDTPDPKVQPDSFVDRPWHRIGSWVIDDYRPAVHYYTYLHHDEGDVLGMLLGYVLLESFLKTHGYNYGFILVESLFPPNWRDGRYDDYLARIDEARLLGGFARCGELSFLSVAMQRRLPMSGRPRGAMRGDGHPLEGAHRAYALDYVLPFARSLATTSSPSAAPIAS